MFSPDRCAALVARIDGATAGPHNTVCVPFKRAVASAHKNKALVKGGGLVYVQTGKDFGSNGLQTVVEPPCDENLDYVYKLPVPTEARGADSAPKKRRLVCLWRKEDKRCWIVGEVGPKAKTLTVSSTKRMAMLVGRGKEGRVYVPRERGIGETVTEMGKNDGLLCMQFVGYEGLSLIHISEPTRPY